MSDALSIGLSFALGLLPLAGYLVGYAIHRPRERNDQARRIEALRFRMGSHRFRMAKAAHVKRERLKL